MAQIAQRRAVPPDRSAAELRSAPVQPLGPDSLVWRLGFSRTGLLYAGRALMLQVAHPVIGAGVRDFSQFSVDPWGRLERSVDSLLTQLFGGERLVAESAWLREMHKGIGGVGFAGERYSALQPEAWAWVHLTNFDTTLRYHDALVRPLSLAERRELYLEWKQIGLLLGIKAERVPASYDGVAEYVDGMVRERLTANATTRQVLDSLMLQGVEPPYGFVPARVWAAAKPIGRYALHDFTVGTLPPALRDRLGLDWTPRDEARLRRLSTAVRLATANLPARLHHYPAGYRAMRAAKRYERTR